ncbi:T6SS immunity protein Tdi1 domain-containing protein [Roseateles sp. BYS87W]|uniref:T6SS immunity protein Tdi1 domain-containing protein n=1 Tax=Pelomonas baiyunensis TaxID=3299026 RepID=A0ABW7GYQ0_9BURK
MNGAAPPRRTVLKRALGGLSGLLGLTGAGPSQGAPATPAALDAVLHDLTARGLMLPATAADPTWMDDWRWLVGAPRQLLRVSALGDALLTERDGAALWWLDTQGGTLVRVADSPAALAQRLTDPEFVDDRFMPDAVADLRAAGLRLGPRQVYALKTPMVLGGRFERDNIEVSDAAVSFSLLGQIHAQVHDLPPGTPIRSLKLRPR